MYVRLKNVIIEKMCKRLKSFIKRKIIMRKKYHLTDNMLVRVDLPTVKYPQAFIGFKSSILWIRYFKYFLSCFLSLLSSLSWISLFRPCIQSEHSSIELVRVTNQIKLHKSRRVYPIRKKRPCKLKVIINGRISMNRNVVNTE